MVHGRRLFRGGTARARAHPPGYDLEEIAADRGATVRRDALWGVNAADHLALTNDGDELPYDHLVVAVGARACPAVAGALTFAGRRDQVKALRGVVNRVVAGRIRRVAFAIPEGPSWPLPGYELALMIAGGGVDDIRVSLVTPEAGPLEVFGAEASDAVRRGRVPARDIECVTGLRRGAPSVG